MPAEITASHMGGGQGGLLNPNDRVLELLLSSLTNDCMTPKRGLRHPQYGLATMTGLPHISGNTLIVMPEHGSCLKLKRWLCRIANDLDKFVLNGSYIFLLKRELSW